MTFCDNNLVRYRRLGDVSGWAVINRVINIPSYANIYVENFIFKFIMTHLFSLQNKQKKLNMQHFLSEIVTRKFGCKISHCNEKKHINIPK